MPIWTLWGQPYAEIPSAPYGKDGRYTTMAMPPSPRPITVLPCEMSPPGGRPSSDKLKKLLEFTAETDDDAKAFFIHCQNHGVPSSVPAAKNDKPRWRYRGAPHYHAVQGRRLLISAALAKRCDFNAEAKSLQSVLGQLSRRYHDVRGNINDFNPNQPDRQVASATLTKAEEYVSQLHCLAAAAQSSVDEAYLAWGLEPPIRNFCVLCRSDVPEPVIEVTPPTEPQSEPPPTKADGKPKQTAGVK